jgi:hypothetical protein
VAPFHATTRWVDRFRVVRVLASKVALEQQHARHSVRHLKARIGEVHRPAFKMRAFDRSYARCDAKPACDGGLSGDTDQSE